MDEDGDEEEDSGEKFRAANRVRDDLNVHSVHGEEKCSQGS